MWAPYVPFDHMIRALSHSQGPIATKLSRLRQCILEGMLRAAQHRVAQKIETEGWAGGINFGWLAKLSRIKKSWCNGICRFAVLRWALNQDDDVWMSLRGTRHHQPCQLCGRPTDIYPGGFWHSPICEACVGRHMITPANLYESSSALYNLYIPDHRTLFNISQPFVNIVEAHLDTVANTDSQGTPMDSIIRNALRGTKSSLPPVSSYR